MKPKKYVVVTGSNGLVGYNLSKVLLDRGYSVFGTFFKSNKNTIILNDHKLFSCNKVDLRCSKSVNNFLKDKKVDCVFHTAARLPTSSTDEDKLFFEHNSRATEILLKACVKYGIQRFIMSSTISVYGGDVMLDYPLNERYLPIPVSAYAHSKLLAEEHCNQFSRKSSLNVCTLRYSGIYGITRESGVVYNFTRNALANNDLLIKKDKIKDIISVEDVVDANISAYLLLDEIGSTIFNIGSGDPISVSELAKHIIRRTNSDSKIMFESSKEVSSSRYYDISKARKILEFNPNSTKKAINKFIINFQQNKRNISEKNS